MANNILFVCVLISFVVTAVIAQNYCSLCADHTMCKYLGRGAACSPYITGGVNAAAKATILDLHNKHRQRVANGRVRQGSPGPQPAAANMREMVWNNEIAAIAQRWVDQCSFGHDSCRKVSKFGVGQNAYMSSSSWMPSGPQWRSAVDAWYNEVTLFNPAWISPFQFSNAIGHYSQVAWAETYSVGCGYAMYKNPNDPTMFRQFYLCNYGPGGNFIRGTMYKRGAACSQCPGSCSTKYPGLCK